MAKYKYLNKKQLMVLDDLFNSDLDEQGVLDKHKVRRSTYERWLETGLFSERFNRYVNRIRRRSELLMAKYRCLAAAKLVELTASEKAETARKACLDIISAPKSETEKNNKQGTTEEGREPGVENQQSNTAFTPETASKLLTVLAEGKKMK